MNYGDSSWMVFKSSFSIEVLNRRFYWSFFSLRDHTQFQINPTYCVYRDGFLLFIQHRGIKQKIIYFLSALEETTHKVIVRTVSLLWWFLTPPHWERFAPPAAWSSDPSVLACHYQIALSLHCSARSHQFYLVADKNKQTCFTPYTWKFWYNVHVTMSAQQG